MSEFMEFDSIEDALDFMREQEEEANRNLAPEQEAIGWGDYWIRFMHDPVYAIFGRIFTEEEFRDNEARLIEAQGDPVPGELESVMATLRESHSRGYRFGRAFSIIEPQGELGDTHIFNMWPIDHTLFEAAEKVSWEIADLDEDALAQAELAYESHRAHLGSLSGEHPMFRQQEGGSEQA